MKTATLILTALTLSAPSAYSQAAGGYAAAATQTSAQGSTQTLGHATQGAATQSAGSNASAAASRNPAGAVAGETTSTAMQARHAKGETGAAATQATNLSAELTQKLSSKNAKVGDDVVARTTSTAQLAGGTKLPKGTRLMGKVTEVRPKSAAEHDGHLAFAFDRAVLRDGREIPIHAALQSISAPAAVSAMGSGSDDFATAPAPIALSGGGQASGGGLLGGAAVPHTALVSNTVSGAASTVASAPVRVTSTAGAALSTTAHGAGAAAGATAGAVSGLPGLTASSSGSNNTMLDAKGTNVDLSSGTQLSFSVMAQ